MIEINPIIFTIRIGNFALPLHWYGVFVTLGVLVASWVSYHEIKRRGENPEIIWDAMVIFLPVGIIGARLWYVANDILGGGTRYLEKPIDIINIPQGGLHFFGGVLFGAIAFYFFARYHKLDMWVILDAVAPNLLIGQGVARPANFINQELYGQPTDLPWGIPISGGHRLAPWNDLSAFPVETTRFHPTFAYEMIWNFAAAGFLLWFARRYHDRLKPGTMFYGWLIMAGVGRIIIENFRPDQPRLPGTDLSISRLVAIIMTVVGIFMLLVRYEIIRIPFLSPGPEAYKIAPKQMTEEQTEE